MTRRNVLKISAVLPLTRFASAFQGGGKRVSPHETVSAELGGKTISIVYGRPYLKGRPLRQLTPIGQVWRLGADEATKITVQEETLIGAIKLLPGSYSLFAIPGSEKWTIIVNKIADQWGAFKYDQSQDLGRFDVKVEKASAPVEEFTISLEKESGKSAKLTFAWGGESLSTTLKSV